MTDDAIKAYVRLRPMNDLEISLHSTECVTCDNNAIRVTCDGAHHVFAFDRVFSPHVSQNGVFEEAAKPIVTDVFKGYNGTIFTYGQTGSGKTHTMVGPAGHPGILPLAVQQIFTSVREASQNIHFEIKVSVVEIYNERVRDLLLEGGQNTDLMLYEDVKGGGGVKIKNCTELFMTSAEEVSASVYAALSHRVTSSTRMNEVSSRSHCIVCIRMSQKDAVTGETKLGKLFLVDLAGSEKISKTAAVAQTLKEAKNINRSLSCLTSVIVALTEASGNKKTHIPYRDSKLTRLLQDSLGGNARTALVLCCSTASYNAEEIIATLRFGVTAKKVVNRARVNREETADELQPILDSLLEEIARLRKGKGFHPELCGVSPAAVLAELQQCRQDWVVEEATAATHHHLARLQEHELRCAARLCVDTAEARRKECVAFEEEYRVVSAQLHERSINLRAHQKAMGFKRTLLAQSQSQSEKACEDMKAWQKEVEAVAKVIERNAMTPGEDFTSSPDDGVFLRWASQAHDYVYPATGHLAGCADAVVALNVLTHDAMAVAGAVVPQKNNENENSNDLTGLVAHRQHLLTRLETITKQGIVPVRLVAAWGVSRGTLEDFKRAHGKVIQKHSRTLDAAAVIETRAGDAMSGMVKAWGEEHDGLAEKWRATRPQYCELMAVEASVDDLTRHSQRASHENYLLRVDMQRYERMLSMRNDRVDNLNKGVREGWKAMNRTHADILQERTELQSAIDVAKIECERWRDQAIRCSFFSPVKQQAF